MRIGLRARDALLRARAGRVVSAYTRAVNVSLETGDLVTLLPAGSPLHPWALAVDGVLPAMATGDAVRIGDGVLAGGSFRANLADARATDLALASRSASSPPRIHIEMLGALMEGRVVGPDEPADSPAGERIAAALEAFAVRGDVSALAALIGLGAGLTPSGDDVVVGVLCGLDLATGYSPPARDLRTALCAALPRPLKSATTHLSAQMVRAAGEGQYPEPLLQLARALAVSDSSAELVRKETMGLLEVGHRSGCEMLRGFHAAVRRTPGSEERI